MRMSGSRVALALGLLGLIPFAGFAALAWGSADPAVRLAHAQAEVMWGAIILSFMAGARWAFALAGPAATPTRLMAFGLIPALSLLAPWLPTVLGLVLLAAGFVGLLVLELPRVPRQEAPDWYPALRVFLTVVAVACLLSVAVRLA